MSDALDDVIAEYFDEGSFTTLAGSDEPESAVGFGRVMGRTIAFYRVPAGDSGKTSLAARMQLIVRAASSGVPVVSVWDGALELQRDDRLSWLTGFLRTMSDASGVVPQLMLTASDQDPVSCAVAHLSDFVITAGSDDRASWEGVFGVLSDALSFLPDNYLDSAPTVFAEQQPGSDHLAGIVPREPLNGYDTAQLVETLADDGQVWFDGGDAETSIAGFLRLDGLSVGVVASQPLVKAGAFTAPAARRAARFVRFCDAFSIPLLTIVDSPGLLQVEGEDAYGAFAELCAVYAAATTPLITFIPRRAKGYAAVFAHEDLGADAVIAWPGAAIGAVPESWRTSSLRAVDVEPADTAPYLARLFAILVSKREVPPLRKHRSVA